MSYSDSRGFTDTQDNQKDFKEKFVDNDAGPYIATVKVTNDPLRMGRLGVNIPALTLTTNPGPEQIIWCHYLSPFYGAKSIEAVSKSDPYGYKETQHSYGMWAVPPDIDTEVLVIFAKGEQSNNTAFWMGCVQKPLVNQQVPANGATENSRLGAGGVDFSQTKQQAYGTDLLPAGEKNQRLYADGETLSNLETWKYPVNDRLADQLNDQGLVQDSVRGTTTSSARRESPSRVFGMNTPGRIREDSRELNIGLSNSKIKTDRDPGHSFVMDDGARDGTNQLTRLRTASGHQLLMHDTEGVVYIANGSGKAFIEMDRDGTVSLYSDGGINMRTSRDFNLHSDMNINFHAKGVINFTSETNVGINAEGYLFAMGQKGILNSSQGGAVRHYARDGISSFTDGTQLHGASGQIHLAGSQVHFNSQNASKQWGPSWLKPDAIGIKVTEGLIDIDDDQAIVQGKPTKIENRTTVSDFVTHEPYDRQSSTQRIKTFINEAMAEIKKGSVVNDIIERIKKTNPEISSTELERIKAELMEQPSIKAVADQLNKLNIKIKLPTVNLNNLGISATEFKVIKTELLKQRSIKAVSNKLARVVNLNDKISLPVKNLNSLITKADQIQQLINLDPKNAVMSFVQGKVASFVNTGISAVRSFFRF